MGQEPQLTWWSGQPPPPCSSPAPRQAKIPECKASSDSQWQNSLNTSRNRRRVARAKLLALLFLLHFFKKEQAIIRAGGNGA